LEGKLCASQAKYIAFQLTTYIYFLNPARRPQDALRQRRDGVKEDYYV